MMSNESATKAISLKEILAKLRETHSLLYTVDGRLNYLANNAPTEASKDATNSGEAATLDSLNQIANALGRRASNIASHTSKIVGN